MLAKRGCDCTKLIVLVFDVENQAVEPGEAVKPILISLGLIVL